MNQYHQPNSRPEDRRQHARFDASSISVDYASGETFLFAYLQNISEMGIFIRSDSPLEIGSRLRLRFNVEDGEPVEIDGEVVWVNPIRPDGDNLNPGMGVRFQNLTPELRERVVELVRTVAYLRNDEQMAD